MLTARLKTSVLGVNIDAVTMDAAVRTVMGFMDTDSMKAIYTVSPEIALFARKNEDYAKILNNGDLITPDGIGVVFASKLNKTKLRERVSGCDLVYRLFPLMRDGGKTVYFLGGAPGVAIAAKANIEREFPGIKIVGAGDGFFYGSDGNALKDKEQAVIDAINRVKPDLLLVGTGFPKQERWIDKHRHILHCRAAIGVGGSLDVYAGTVKRAPRMWVKFNLEWLYRLLSEPRKRFVRQMKLPVFVFAVLAQCIKRIVWRGSK
jgi:N-acetylglucosaminyldiphosphoundecaprenol N-acetyl-beta-D-mannosaminyltransferase